MGAQQLVIRYIVTDSKRDEKLARLSAPRKIDDCLQVEVWFVNSTGSGIGRTTVTCGIVPTGPLIYRFYELMNVYGTTFKALIHEEFGDGIMSAIDFDMSLERLLDPKGDRVKITMSGKFLPYKTY